MRIMNFLVIATIAGLLAVAFGIYQTVKILALPKGTPAMIAIADAIAEGAQAYLKRQYKVVALIALVIAVILYFALGWLSAVAFIIGAGFSAAAGFVGMNISVRANVRTSEAARKGLQNALS